ncbi:monovalent cation/H(+) antiporter subunit G [Acetomicrobium sp. S15 = DSM 107314]|uniref:monovalent cation/H(+) antiporter subunit G n=1 Tax=Acetomicrobium sp. S15 = DSM 107314 TaxID=2529858 RepID=UPI0018E107BC|nr:monovalent cation/H(+) antiporter subunit G [Acetomicrobium sp. S15 = DSM 107314]
MRIEVSLVVAYTFMVVGVFFSITSALGIIRFPDVYARIHAGTKALTGGALMVLVGAAIYAPTWQATAKILLIALFFVFTNPLSSHAIARACFRHGIRPKIVFKDDYSEALANSKEEIQS